MNTDTYAYVCTYICSYDMVFMRESVQKKILMFLYFGCVCVFVCVCASLNLSTCRESKERTEEPHNVMKFVVVFFFSLFRTLNYLLLLLLLFLCLL